jgi:pentatricopeptide repeat protein
MSEMLANQYFMVRKFSEAETAYEKVLIKDPLNKAVRKKLIVCYAHNCKVRKALELFYRLIREDIRVIINTDVVADDCPCPELINKFELSKKSELSYVETLEVFGILWLFCDINKSVEFFEKLKEYNPKENIYKEILSIYSSYNLEKIKAF